MVTNLTAASRYNAGAQRERRRELSRERLKAADGKRSEQGDWTVRATLLPRDTILRTEANRGRPEIEVCACVRASKALGGARGGEDLPLFFPLQASIYPSVKRKGQIAYKASSRSDAL